MEEPYGNKAQLEAEKIADSLKQLDNLLNSENLVKIYAGDLNELRRNIRRLLISLNADLESLKSIEKDDIFRTNPIYATQRYQLIRTIETTKVDFEFDIFPTLQKLTKEALEGAKQNPSSLDIRSLDSTASVERWTSQKVIETAQQFIDKAGKVVGIATRAYTLVRALGLLSGNPIP
jgi:hypothetical protein